MFRTLLFACLFSVPLCLSGEDIQGPSVRVAQSQIDAAIENVYPSLVRIHVIMESPKDGRMQKHGGTGSGTIIHPDGYILTNHHVAGHGARIWVRLSNKAKVDARVVGTDPQTDLCVIQLDMEQVPDEMLPLPVGKFGDVETLRLGDTVLAMGSPAGVSQSVTVGVVANLEMITPQNRAGVKQDGERVGDLVRWIGHDAVIFFGNSGGPLVNLSGDIVGVNEVGLGSLGGAIPGDVASYVMNELIEHGTVRRSWTGLICQPMLRSASDVDGVLVSAVIEGSPAEDAGFEAGDVVVRFDGVEVRVAEREHLPLFNRVVLGTPVGKRVEVLYKRGGVAKAAQLRTAERSPARAKDFSLPDWGITARDLTLRSAITLERDDTDGVLVSTLSRSGAAASAKPALVARDLIVRVNGEDTQNLDELRQITVDRLGDSEVGVDTLVEFERDGQLLATVVELGKQPNESDSAAARRAWIGLNTQVITRDLAAALGAAGKRGVRVTEIIPGSTAEKAEIQKGDLLLRIDGAVIRAEREHDSDIFDSMIREYPSDATVTFDLIRAGETLKIACALEPAPKASRELKKLINKDLEFTMRETSGRTATEAAITEGVYVDNVERAGWASLGGLAGGDVILSIDGESVNSLDAAEALFNQAKEARQEFIVIALRRGKLTRFIEIHPTWDAL